MVPSTARSEVGESGHVAVAKKARVRNLAPAPMPMEAPPLTDTELPVRRI